MAGKFTGRHMAALLCGGFGIVLAVNLAMASFAASTFGGVVVENSYVASQKFNSWLEEAERSRRLGWTVELERGEGGRLLVIARGVPDGVQVSGVARHPLGVEDDRLLAFDAAGDGLYRSREVLGNGRWTVRLEMRADGERWRGERKVR